MGGVCPVGRFSKWAVAVSRSGEVRVICRGGKVWVTEAMVPEILTMYHDDRGQFGVKITVHMIQEKFWIPKITGVVSEYIRKCGTC